METSTLPCTKLHPFQHSFHTLDVKSIKRLGKEEKEKENL